MKLIEMTLTGFVDTTASDAPAPGGGSISALEGALDGSIEGVDTGRDFGPEGLKTYRAGRCGIYMKL